MVVCNIKEGKGCAKANNLKAYERYDKYPFWRPTSATCASHFGAFYCTFPYNCFQECFRVNWSLSQTAVLKQLGTVCHMSTDQQKQRQTLQLLEANWPRRRLIENLSDCVCRFLHETFSFFFFSLFFYGTLQPLPTLKGFNG